MKCPHCSLENSDEAPFCEGCGHVFLSSDRAPEAGAAPERATRREAVLGSVPPVVKVPDIAVPAPDTTGGIGATGPVGVAGGRRPVVPEVVPSASGHIARPSGPLPSVAGIVDPLPEPPQEPDFSGFERLVDSSYVPPVPAPGAGDTAEIPVVRDGYVPHPRNYTLGLSPREQKKRDREQRRLEKKFAKAQQKEEMRAAREEARLQAAVAAAEREERLAAAAAAREERKLARDDGPRGVAGTSGTGSAAGVAPAAADCTDDRVPETGPTAGLAGLAAREAVPSADRTAALELPAAEMGIALAGERGIERVPSEEEESEQGLATAEQTRALKSVSAAGEMAPRGPQALENPAPSTSAVEPRPAETAGPADDARRLALSAACLLKTLAFSGLRPSLAVCVGCGAPVPALEGRRVPFSAIEGGVACTACRSSLETELVDAVSLGWASYFLGSTFDDVAAGPVDLSASFAVLHLVQALVRAHVGSPLKSLEFLFTSGLF